jgi:DNA-binding transcriptional LysR family regulator
VEAARRSLEVLDNAEREVGLLEGFERGSLSIAAHPCLVETHLVPAVAAMLRGSANLHCRIQSASPDAMLQALRSRQIELFVGLEPDGPCDDVAIERVGTYRPVPFCRAGHPLAAVKPQGIKVLGRYPLVTTEMPAWYARRVEAGMPRDPILAGEIAERGRRVQVAHQATMETLVETTDSLGLAAAESIRPSIEAGKLVVLGVPRAEQVLVEPAAIVLVTVKDRPLPPSANAVIERIRSESQRGVS